MIHPDIKKLKAEVFNGVHDRIGYQEGWSECIDYFASQCRIVPDGWVAVPKEPTDKMLRVGECIADIAYGADELPDPKTVYTAMLTEAPEPFKREKS